MLDRQSIYWTQKALIKLAYQDLNPLSSKTILINSLSHIILIL